MDWRMKRYPIHFEKRMIEKLDKLIESGNTELRYERRAGHIRKAVEEYLEKYTPKPIKKKKK